VPAATLAAQGVDDAAAAYAVGQVVKCRVAKCVMGAAGKDGRKHKPRLTLALDLPGFLGTDGGDGAAAEASASVGGGGDGEETEGPIPGTLVTGKVLRRTLPSPDVAAVGGGASSAGGHSKAGSKASKASKGSGKDGSGGEGGAFGSVVIALDAPFEGLRAMLPLSHAGDFGALAVARASVDDAFQPGRSLGPLLVLSARPRRPATVTMKPLLLAAAAAAAKGGVKLRLPEKFDELQTAGAASGAESGGGCELVAGSVRGIEAFGVFVECLGGLSALVPRAHVASSSSLSSSSSSVSASSSTDLTAALRLGDSVVCAVHAVDAAKGRLVLSAKAVPCGLASAAATVAFLPALLRERHAAAGARCRAAASGGGARAGAAGLLPDARAFPLGTTLDGTVTGHGSDGSLLLLAQDGVTRLVAPANAGGSGARSSGGAGSASGQHAAGSAGLALGAVVKVRVLDVAYGNLDAVSYAPGGRAASVAGADACGASNGAGAGSGPDAGGCHLVVSVNPALVKAGRSKRRKAAAASLGEEATHWLGPGSDAASSFAAAAAASGGDKEPKSAKKKAKAAAAAAGLAAGVRVTATVLLVEPAWGYAVVSLPAASAAAGGADSGEGGGGVLGFLSLADFSCPSRGVSAAAAGGGVAVGGTVACVVVVSPARAAWVNGADDSDGAGADGGVDAWHPAKHAVFLQRSEDAAAADKGVVVEALADKGASGSGGASGTSGGDGGTASVAAGSDGVFPAPASWKEVASGRCYRAAVTGVREEGAEVRISPASDGDGAIGGGVEGFVSVLALAASPSEAEGWSRGKLKAGGKSVKAGQELLVVAVGVDRKRRTAAFVLRRGDHSPAAGSSAVPTVAVGVPVLCRVMEPGAHPVPSPPALMVELPGGRTGRVCATELCDAEGWASVRAPSMSFLGEKRRKDI